MPGQGVGRPLTSVNRGLDQRHSERRRRERRAPRGRKLEKVRSGTFPDPREGSGSPPHSLSPDPSASSPRCPEPAHLQRRLPGQPRRQVGLVEPPAPGSLQTSKREPRGPRGRSGWPGPRAPLCSDHLPLPSPDLDPEGCPEAQGPEQADPLLSRGRPRQEVSDHRPGTRGGVYRVGRSHAMHRESLKLKSINLSPGHSGEMGPRAVGSLHAGAPLPRRGWAPPPTLGKPTPLARLPPNSSWPFCPWPPTGPGVPAAHPHPRLCAGQRPFPGGWGVGVVVR